MRLYSLSEPCNLGAAPVVGVAFGIELDSLVGDGFCKGNDYFLVIIADDGRVEVPGGIGGIAVESDGLVIIILEACIFARIKVSKGQSCHLARAVSLDHGTGDGDDSRIGSTFPVAMRETDLGDATAEGEVGFNSRCSLGYVETLRLAALVGDSECDVSTDSRLHGEVDAAIVGLTQDNGKLPSATGGPVTKVESRGR